MINKNLQDGNAPRVGTEMIHKKELNLEDTKSALESDLYTQYRIAKFDMVGGDPIPQGESPEMEIEKNDSGVRVTFSAYYPNTKPHFFEAVAEIVHANDTWTMGKLYVQQYTPGDIDSHVSQTHTQDTPPEQDQPLHTILFEGMPLVLKRAGI